MTQEPATQAGPEIAAMTWVTVDGQSYTVPFFVVRALEELIRGEAGSDAAYIEQLTSQLDQTKQDAAADAKLRRDVRAIIDKLFAIDGSIDVYVIADTLVMALTGDLATEFDAVRSLISEESPDPQSEPGT